MRRPSEQNLLDEELMDALHGDRVPKFLATLDGAGKPNVVPITTLDAADERTLIFAELFIWKTKANLGTQPRVGVAVVTEDLRVWTVRGRFREFVTGGPCVERMNQKDMFRYNAYMGVRRAGVIDVESVTDYGRLSRLALVVERLVLRVFRGIDKRTAAGKAPPPRVAEKFARIRAVKVIAFRGHEGYPVVVPALSLLPTRSETVLFGAGLLETGRFRSALQALRPGAVMAASVITLDPIAYQIKGTFVGQGRAMGASVGKMRVEEVYSASPPLAGERIDLQTPARGPDRQNRLITDDEERPAAPAHTDARIV